NRWCVVHLYGAARRRLLGKRRHLRYESPHRVVELCRQHGFADVELHWMPVLPARAQRLQAMLESPPWVWLLRHVPLLGMLVSHSFIVRAGRPTAARSPATTT